MTFKKLQAKRDDRCGVCGGRQFIEAVDNFGNRYVGCDRCRLLTMDEINAIARKQPK